MYLVRVKAWMKCHMVDRGHIGVLLCQACNVPRLRWPLFFPEVAVGKHLFHNSRRGKNNCFSNQLKKIIIILCWYKSLSRIFCGLNFSNNNLLGNLINIYIRNLPKNIIVWM